QTTTAGSGSAASRTISAMCRASSARSPGSRAVASRTLAWVKAFTGTITAAGGVTGTGAQRTAGPRPLDKAPPPVRRRAAAARPRWGARPPITVTGMPIRVAVVGAGSWGTTVAALASRNTPTVLWARRPELVEAMARTRRNTDYLPDFELPAELEVTASLEEAVRDADVLVMGVPSHGMRATLRELAGHVRPWIPVMSLAKGLEEGTHLRMTEVIEQELPGHPVGVMTGPNLAREIMAGHAAATVVAFSDRHVATELQRLFARELFRVYTNHDVVGCELGGALKNVFAIASGMADGLGTGDNTRAAVITRSLAELSRLGLALGGEVMTFAGLAGMGDL